MGGGGVEVANSCADWRRVEAASSGRGWRRIDAASSARCRRRIQGVGAGSSLQSSPTHHLQKAQVTI